MQKVFGQNDQQIAEYVEKLFCPNDPILQEILERSKKKGLPEIQVGSTDGVILEVLTRSFGTSKAVEIGTLGGYSGVCIARGLKENGKLYTFEYNQSFAEVAKESFQKAGLLNKVEIFVGAALDNLPKIVKAAPFDLCFIDADKVNYSNYLAWAADNLRIGGVVLGDNAFAWNYIAKQQVPKEEENSVLGLRKFNESLAKNPRFRSIILPTGEGLAMGVKIS